MEAPKRRLVWSDEAEQDLLAVWRYGVDEWSPTKADRHLLDIERTCERLCSLPELGRARDELMRGVRSILCDPQIIFYRIAADTVEIMRVRPQQEDVAHFF
jgi:toxin ParE1/3/4